MKLKWVVAAGLLCAATTAWAGADIEPPARSSIKHFTQIDKQVFAGSKPTRDVDFKFLQSIGVKYILQAHFLPFFTGGERKQAAKYGMEYIAVEMNASPISPMERHVDKALRIMRTRQPIYIHCVLGRDRTSLLAGLYRLYFEGYSVQADKELMQKEGFRDVFFLHGLKAYFDNHLATPRNLADVAH